ncbi:histidinol dehydrogenase [Halobellus ruber]|uniref:Histidinol dehydrogenase n=1 Tax=Halobellus ruber TaxID=2761102 RepID=A0A7J9SLF1_9EURY|nr:histidinol dehydrogenase [Halobellus ruber]MBB6647203.1 histidinol dehydrogenase [Halobellus ruber]
MWRMVINIDTPLDRDAGVDEVRQDVADIIAQVRTEGDEALRSFSWDFDGVALDALDVTDAAEAAADQIDSGIPETILSAIENVRKFHERQVREDWVDSFGNRTMGRQFRHIERVGAYVPGGNATYPSTAVMTVVPAKVAGVEKVAVVTPPAEELNRVTLAAIHLAGADEVYVSGGAQAVAALAYGTETVPSVEKIVGPGNRWVAAAKAEVRGDVAIDMIAGPTEVLVVVGGSADAEIVAAELVGQAEHDPHFSTVVVTPDGSLAAAVTEAIERQTPDRERSGIIRDALRNDSSGVFVADSMDDATDFAEAYAAEHLVVMTEEPGETLENIDSAGSVFLGEYSPVAAGDYAAGPNHVLPTSGAARTAGGLSVDSFVRSRTVQHLDEARLASISEAVVSLAELEGLEAHAESVRKRFE